MGKYINPGAETWRRENLMDPANIPFSFTYREKRYHGFDPDCFSLLETKRGGDEKKQTLTWSLMADDGLKIRVDTAFYPQYGASEWTIWFENTAQTDSGVLEDMVTTLEFPGEHPVLRGILGDHENDYMPYETDLLKQEVHFVSDSGRATHVNFPYFNLEAGDGGCMLAIGWAGTWTADFVYEDGQTVYTARSIQNLKTYLKPGEKLRTALFVRAPYAVRDVYYAMNFWRSWFIDCNLPKADAEGNPVTPFSTCCISNDTGLPNSDGSISERWFTWKPTLEKMIAEDAKVDFRWFDAGWYLAPDGSSPETDWWGTVGTWELDHNKWPGQSFLESTEYAREHGMKTLMWFEPERITDPENLAKYYGYNPDWAIQREGHKAISNNIGVPECLAWTTERVCKVLRENKVEMYREDNNSDPAALWSYLDEKEGKNRQGITESRFIIGHYKMWDDIIACTLSYGGCGFVDSCASGGGRNDLESLRRGIPLLRSDADRTTTALRLSMSWGFNQWIPVCGANTKEKLGQLDPTGRSDVYTWRASYLPILNVDSQFTQDPDQDFDMLRFGLKEWKRLSPYMMKDFYPLTAWHDQRDKSGFTAWSYFDSEAEKGFMLIFRQEECEADAVNLRLPFASDNGRYRLRDEDSGEIFAVSGETLRKDGFSWMLSEKRMARLIWIEKE